MAFELWRGLTSDEMIKRNKKQNEETHFPAAGSGHGSGSVRWLRRQERTGHRYRAAHQGRSSKRQLCFFFMPILLAGAR